MSDLVPRDWQRRSLSSLGEYNNGFAFNESHWADDGLPIVRIAQITGSKGVVDRYQGQLPDSFRIDNGDLVFSWSGTLAVVRWAGGPAWLNQHLFKVVPAPGIDNSFLLHLLRASVAEMSKRTHGSTMKHIKRGELQEFHVSVPLGLDEQKQIAHILDTCDAVIQKTEALLDNLKAIKQGLLHDLLTRGIDANGRLRPPQPEAPHLYKASALGWIPEKWEVCGVLDVAPVGRQCILTGPFGADLGRADFKDEGVPVLRIGNVQAGFIDWADTLCVAPKKAELLTKYRVVEGDLLFARQGATTGRNALADSRADGSLINYHIIRVAVDHEKCHPTLLYSLFNSATSKAQVDQAKGRGTREGINSGQIASFRFALPHPDEQKQLVERINAINETISCESLALEKLYLEKSALMDDLLTGRVRVTPLLKSASA